MEGFAKIFFLMLVGGGIALFGDWIGKYVGKRKLTIFNLRPRYTSRIFTVLFGMLICLFTFGFLAWVSKDARQSLFEVRSLESRRQKLEKDILQLSKVTTLNELVFHINQPMVMGAIDGGRPTKEIEAALMSVLSKANQVAVLHSNEAAKLHGVKGVVPDTQLVVQQKNDFERAVSYLSKKPERFAVIVYSLQNSYLDEKIMVGFDIRENKRVFQTGQVITSKLIDGSQSSDQILVELFDLLSQLQQSALSGGMLPDPVTNNFGGNILVASLFDKRDRIKSMGKAATVKVIANHDLYTVGPLDVRFDVE